MSAQIDKEPDEGKIVASLAAACHVPLDQMAQLCNPQDHGHARAARMLTRTHIVLDAAACGVMLPALTACSAGAGEQEAARALRRPLAMAHAGRRQLMRELVRYATLAPSSKQNPVQDLRPSAPGHRDHAGPVSPQSRPCCGPSPSDSAPVATTMTSPSPMPNCSACRRPARARVFT
jgi:hypothetical protein